MKVFFQVFCLVLICSVAVTGNCTESYRAYFEVDVEDGPGKSTISSPSDVVSGIPITFEVGKKILSLLFNVEPPPSDEYSVTVSLLAKAKSTNDLSATVLTHTFHSNLVGGKNGPLEFEMQQNGIKIGGVVALSLIR